MMNHVSRTVYDGLLGRICTLSSDNGLASLHRHRHSFDSWLHLMCAQQQQQFSRFFFCSLFANWIFYFRILIECHSENIHIT